MENKLANVSEEVINRVQQYILNSKISKDIYGKSVYLGTDNYSDIDGISPDEFKSALHMLHNNGTFEVRFKGSNGYVPCYVYIR